MLTQEELKIEVTYNRDNGLFFWNTTKSGRNSQEACLSGSDGYLQLCINGKQYKAHRLAWLYEYGHIPESKQIDHINGVRTDNRIENLRIVTHSENQKNRKRNSNNKSGVTGVNWDKRRNKWVANIKVDNKKIYLGGFEIFSDAVNARKNAEVLYGFHENHGKEI